MSSDFKKKRDLEFSKIVYIVLLIFIVFFVCKYTQSYLQHKHAGELYNSYCGCSFSMAKIENALNLYKQRNGKYPDTLSKLIPVYLGKIPECPACGSDTYSSSYLSTSYPVGYFFCCQGKNHIGPENTPQRVSNLAFYDRKDCEPECYVYEKGRMPEVMGGIEKASRHIFKSEFQEAIVELDLLLKEQVAWRDHLYMMKALCYLKRSEPDKAYEAINKALELNFNIDDWNRILPMLDNPDSRAVLEKPLLKYVESHDDIDAIIVLLKLCGLVMEKKDQKMLCEKGLAIVLTNKEPIIPEFFFRGKLAGLKGNKPLAKSFYMAIRGFSSSAALREQIISILSEKEIDKLD